MTTRPALILALCVLIGGCSFPGAIHHEIFVSNFDDETHRVQVTIERDGSTILEETKELSPSGQSWVVTELEDAGDYRVVVGIEGGGQTNMSISLPLVEGNRDSYSHVDIEEDGSLTTRTYAED